MFFSIEFFFVWFCNPTLSDKCSLPGESKLIQAKLIHIYRTWVQRNCCVSVNEIKVKILSSLFSSNHLPKHDVTNHFCHPSTQLQELETVKEKWYFSCIMCAHSSWSLIFNRYISEVNCILPTQFQLDFALFPPCLHPLVLHYCTWLSRLPRSNGHHVPMDSMFLHHCLKRCSATAGEVRAT